MLKTTKLIISVYLFAISAANAVTAQECNYSFKFKTTTGFGTIVPGIEFDGQATFQVGKSFAQEGGVVAYVTKGSLSFGSAETGRIKSRLRAFTVGKTDRMLNYYGIEAVTSSGTFGGFGAFVPLANMAFYGGSGSINHDGVPTDASAFNEIDGRKVLQLQTPNAQDVMLADIVKVEGGCS